MIYSRSVQTWAWVYGLITRKGSDVRRPWINNRLGYMQEMYADEEE